MPVTISQVLSQTQIEFVFRHLTLFIRMLVHWVGLDQFTRQLLASGEPTFELSQEPSVLRLGECSTQHPLGSPIIANTQVLRGDVQHMAVFGSSAMLSPVQHLHNGVQGTVCMNRGPLI